MYVLIEVFISGRPWPTAKMKLGHIGYYRDVFFKFDNGTITHNTFSSHGPLFMKIHPFRIRPLSKSNTFDQNFMKLAHIVRYYNVFFKFDNGPYRTILSVVMVLCL